MNSSIINYNSYMSPQKLKLIQIYDSLLNWKNWIPKKEKFQKRKHKKTEKLIEEILMNQYLRNQLLINQGSLPRISIFNAIYEQGVSDTLKNQTSIRNVELVGGGIVLDFNNAQQLDYFYKPNKFEQFKYPSIIQKQLPPTSQMNEKVLRLLFQEGEPQQIKNDFKKRDFYYLVSTLFFLKAVYKIYIKQQ